MNRTESKTFTVYMPRIARELVREGFPILKIVPNEKKPQYYAYVFENTQEFLEAFSKVVMR